MLSSWLYSQYQQLLLSTSFLLFITNWSLIPVMSLDYTHSKQSPTYPPLPFHLHPLLNYHQHLNITMASKALNLILVKWVTAVQQNKDACRFHCIITPTHCAIVYSRHFVIQTDKYIRIQLINLLWQFAKFFQKIPLERLFPTSDNRLQRSRLIPVL